MKKIIYLIIGLLIVSVCFVSAEEDDEATDVEETSTTTTTTTKSYKYEALESGDASLDVLLPKTFINFDWFYQTRNDLQDFNNQDIDYMEFRFEMMYDFEINENLSVGLGYRHEINQIDSDIGFDPAVVDDDNRSFQDIEIPLEISFTNNDRLLVQLGVAARLGSDFRGGFDHRDIELPGLQLKVGYVVIPGLFLFAGIRADDDFGDYAPVPIGGLVWKPDPNFEVVIAAPFMAKMSYRLSEKMEILAFYDLDFNQYRFRFRNGAERDQDEFQTRFARIGLGIEYEFVPGIAFRITGGGTVDGDINFDDNDQLDSDVDGASFFFNMGFTVYSSFFDELNNIYEAN